MAMLLLLPGAGCRSSSRSRGPVLAATSILLALLVLGPGVATACTPVGGWITTDTTWDIAGSPYCVYVNVHVREGATLTIDPGVEVRFDANQSLIVDTSTVVAVGTPDSTIVFTRNTSARWGAICGLAATMTFRHCRVEWGSQQEYPSYNFQEGLISNAVGTTVVEDCVLTNSGVDATEFQGGNVIFRRNLLTFLGRQGVNCWDHCQATVVDNRVFDCNEDAYKFDSLNQAELVFHNNVVHDGGDDGLDMDHMGAVRISCFEAYNVNDKGISVSRNSGRLEGSVIVENAVISGANEGFVATAHSVLSVFNSVSYNCRVASFSAYERYTWAGGSDIYVANSIGWNAPLPVYVDSISTANVWCSILDCDPVYPGFQNSNEDPRFVDAPGYVFSLADGSPAIDAGSADGMPEHDFLGRPRFDVPYVPDRGFGTFTYYDIGAFEFYPPVDGATLAPPAARFGLTVFPSPAVGPVAVAFDLPERGDVALGVYDPAGRLVARLFSGPLERGPHRMTWRTDARTPRGIYFVRLTAGGEEAILKVVCDR